MRVRALAERLRAVGLDVVLDQFFLADNPGGPNEGWDRWSANAAKDSAKVLFIGTPGWFRCFEGMEQPGVGCGAACEARIFYTQLYEAKWVTGTHRILFFEAALRNTTPQELKHLPSFTVPPAAEGDFARVVAWLKGEPMSDDPPARPAIQWPAPLPNFDHGLANRHEKEWPAIVRLLSGQFGPQVLLFEGASNHGKSELVKQAVAYAGAVGIAHAVVDFKGGARTVDDVLGELKLNLRDRLRDFAAQGGNSKNLLREDLRTLDRPVLLVLDSYEKARQFPDLADWLEHTLLREVGSAPGLVIIVSGQSVPDLDKMPWCGRAERFAVGPIALEHWHAWLEKKAPQLVPHLPTLALLTGGVAGTMANSLKTIATAQRSPAP